MKRVALFLSALNLAVGAQRLSAEDSVPAPMPPRPLADVDDFAAQEPIVIQAHFFESDSIENREKGDLRVVSRPTILALADQSFSIHLGGERLVVDHAAGDVESMEVGLRLEGKVGAVRGGTIRVSVSFSHTAVQSADDDSVELYTESKRVLTTVILGETAHIALTPQSENGKTVWVELTFDQEG